LPTAIPADDFRALVESYLDGAIGRLERIQAMARSATSRRLAREAHDLISTSGKFGVSRVQALAVASRPHAGRPQRRGPAAGGRDSRRVLFRMAGDARSLPRR